MKMTASLNQLLIFACPAIRYRARKELLHQSADLPEMIELQSEILQDRAVKKVLNSQGSDGWLGWTFHGYDSMEAGIRLLCEKGLEADQPVLARALLALEKHPGRLERGLGRVGQILDDLGFGGTESIRAYLFAHAGMEDVPLVQEQIKQAIEVFRSVIQVSSLEGLYQSYRGAFVFREGICWPSIYHLRLLAMTRSWRAPENYKIMVESIRQLVRLSPLPDLHVKQKSQVIAPASFCMHDFTPDMNNLSAAEWMQWFHRMELLARLGVIEKIPELKHQVETLENALLEGQGLFIKKLDHIYFQKWGSYTGLALEKDWRLPQRRMNDLTFRSLLILHYSAKK